MPKITHYKIVKSDGVVSIRYQCVGCGKQQETPVINAGGRVQCFACGVELDVPTVQELRDRASGKTVEPPTVEVPPPPPPITPIVPPKTPVMAPSPPPVDGWLAVEAAIHEQTKQDAEFYDRTSWRLFYIAVPFVISFVMGVFVLFLYAFAILLGGAAMISDFFRSS